MKLYAVEHRRRGAESEWYQDTRNSNDPHLKYRSIPLIYCEFESAKDAMDNLATAYAGSEFRIVEMVVLPRKEIDRA